MQHTHIDASFNNFSAIMHVKTTPYEKAVPIIIILQYFACHHCHYFSKMMQCSFFTLNITERVFLRMLFWKEADFVTLRS